MHFVRRYGWMVWAFIPLFSGISFIWAGHAAKVRRWQIWGGLMLVPTVFAFALTSLNDDSKFEPYDVAMSLVIGAWLLAMVLVFVIRSTYEQRLAAQGRDVTAVPPTITATPERPAAAPPAPAPPPPTGSAGSRPSPAGSPQPASGGPAEREALPSVAQAEQELDRAGLSQAPLDVNSADVAELAGLPGLNAALAERAIGYRQARGGFADFSEFISALGLQPHEAERLRTRVTVRASASAARTAGRRLDL